MRRRGFICTVVVGGAVLQLLGCSGAGDIDLSREIFVSGGYLDPQAIAVAKDKEDVYIYAGESTYGESAVAIQLSSSRSEAKVLWRYDRDPRLARIKNGVYFGGGSRPVFRGVVTMQDGSSFLCGEGPADRQENRPGLLFHLDQSGAVLTQGELRSSEIDVSAADRPIDSSRSNELDACLMWGDHIGLIGYVAYYPREGRTRWYYWITNVDVNGKVVWQKLIPQASPMLLSTDFTSARVTPRENLLFTRYWSVTGITELTSISPSGELVSSIRLVGYYIVVSQARQDRPIQIFGGDPRGLQNIVTLDENLNELHRRDISDLKNFMALKAYGRGTSEFLLVGRERTSPESTVSFSAIAHVTEGRSTERMRLEHDDISDGGTARATAPTQHADEFIMARTLLERHFFGRSETLGVALNLIRIPSK